MPAELPGGFRRVPRQVAAEIHRVQRAVRRPAVAREVDGDHQKALLSQERGQPEAVSDLVA